MPYASGNSYSQKVLSSPRFLLLMRRRTRSSLPPSPIIYQALSPFTLSMLRSTTAARFFSSLKQKITPAQPVRNNPSAEEISLLAATLAAPTLLTHSLTHLLRPALRPLVVLRLLQPGSSPLYHPAFFSPVSRRRRTSSTLRCTGGTQRWLGRSPTWPRMP